MATYQRTRTEKRFETPNSITGFRKVKTQKFKDSKTNLNFDFELESINIDVKTNTMRIHGRKTFYDLDGKVFKKQPYSYIDVDTKAEYEIVEEIDEKTEEVLKVVSEKKIKDEYTPITNWDSQVGGLVAQGIINQFLNRNNL